MEMVSSEKIASQLEEIVLSEEQNERLTLYQSSVDEDKVDLQIIEAVLHFIHVSLLHVNICDCCLSYKLGQN